MTPKEIKNKLASNPELIRDILHSMDFHSVNIVGDKRVSAAFPDGDNKSSLQILLRLNDEEDAFLYTVSNTRSFNGGDFFAFVKWHNNFLKDNEAIGFVASEIGESYTYEVDTRESSTCARFLKSFIRKKEKPDSYEEHALNENTMEQFYDVPCKIFFDDNIDAKTQKKFGVRYDYWDNRAVFPIRNDYGQLITVKGRTLESNFKELGVYKYLYYYNYSGAYYLYGLYENLHSIIEQDEAILIEPEKGVMQAYSFGVRNVLAISKKKITPQQIKKLLTLGIRNVTIMLDKDVLEEEVRIECAKFKGLMNIRYTIDTENLLGEKDSPTDKGFEVFTQVYSKRKKYKEVCL